MKWMAQDIGKIEADLRILAILSPDLVIFLTYQNVKSPWHEKSWSWFLKLSPKSIRGTFNLTLLITFLQSQSCFLHSFPYSQICSVPSNHPFTYLLIHKYLVNVSYGPTIGPTAQDSSNKRTQSSLSRNTKSTFLL